MELDFKHASLQEIIDHTPDLRREAYVDATLRMQADDNIVGVFGSAYSEAQSPVIDEATAAVLCRCRLSEWMPLFLNTVIILPAMQSRVRWYI